MNPIHVGGTPVLPHLVYAEELRVHAVALIWMGHQQLAPNSFAIADEDVITGELVRAMKSVQQLADSPPWVDHYEVHEQVRQNVDAKKGKSRPMMDIEFECHRRGPRPRLGFEAKRLGRGSNVSDYLGDEGMAAFLSGYYPTTHGDAGMLGYVQERTIGDWSSRLALELANTVEKHSVVPNGDWQLLNADLKSACSRTCHVDLDGKSLVVFHVLLPFH